MALLALIVGINIGIAIGLFVRLMWFIKKVSDGSA